MEFNEVLKEKPEDNIVIAFRGLKVWTPEEKSWWRRRIIKPKSFILNDGYINEGEFVAVIGPSGAGKTTFLASIAGKSTLPSEGIVSVKGGNVKEGSVEMVPQTEVFMESLTVMEHLVFMIEMKLGSSKVSANRLILKELIHELKLKSIAHSTIRSLSGGERRLVSLANSLLSRPKILICDEPTTGLDSYSAALVIAVLKKIASTGKVVICSVHQPSSEVFKEFNSVILMAEGNILFQGSQEDCRKAFERLNFFCPRNYNLAEFYLKAVSSSKFSENYGNTVVVEKYRRRSSWGHECSPTSYDKKQFCASQRNWFKQVHLLLWRSSLTVSKDLRHYLVQLLVTMTISSIIISTCYVGTKGTTQRGIQDVRGFLWLVCSEVSFSVSYNALYAFEGELPLFKREIGIYSTSAYFVSRFLCLLPRCIIWPTCFVLISSMAVDLPNREITAAGFIAALSVAAVAATAYGLGMGALFLSTGVMADVMPCVDLPLFLMSGAFLRISSLPLWLYPLKYLSHFYYAMDAVSNIYWRQIDHIDCPTNSTTDCIADGLSVLIENGYSNHFVLEDSAGLLLVTLVWSLLAFYGLKREAKKGYPF